VGLAGERTSNVGLISASLKVVQLLRHP
jgi:hypothetical protein